MALLLAAPWAQAAKKKPRVKPLAERIEAVLAEPDIARGHWGIEVVSLDTGRTLYARNAGQLFVPASNVKLLVTAAALELIGPDFRHRTTVETASAPDRYGRIAGDVLLVGRGDPNLSGRTLPYNLRTERALPPVRVLEDLADQVAARGVKVIEGGVIADDTYFAFERYGEGWAQDDLSRPWGAPVSALTLNDNVIFVNVLPADRAGERAFVSLDPFAGDFELDNRVITTASGSGPRNINVQRAPGASQIVLWGSIALDDPGYSEALALDDPAEFAARIFRRLLERRGIAIYGKARAQHLDPAAPTTFRIEATDTAGGGTFSQPAPAAAPLPLVLARHESEPLVEDLRVINKVSQNLHAELTLRLLGREKGTSGTVEAGLEALRAFLTRIGIAPGEYDIYDGSGLSRKNLVTPRALVRLLRYVSGQNWFPLYESTLPVAGVDGSLANRFELSLARAGVRAKTGSLGHVNALSGYAQTAAGERVAFAILANNHILSRSRAEQVIDRIVEVIVEERTRSKRK